MSNPKNGDAVLALNMSIDTKEYYFSNHTKRTCLPSQPFPQLLILHFYPQASITNGPQCQEDLVEKSGLITMHTYYVDKPQLISCN